MPGKTKPTEQLDSNQTKRLKVDPHQTILQLTPVNFKEAKIINQDAGGALFTRDARFVQYKGDTYRVKNPFYNNYVAAEEVIMGSLFSLTGLSAPNMLLCNGCEGFLTFNKETRGDFIDGKVVSSYACVASKVESTFRDLGTFLLEKDTVITLIKETIKTETVSEKAIEINIQHYLSSLKQYETANEELKVISTQYPNHGYRKIPTLLETVKQKNLVKFKNLEKMNDLLPNFLKQEQLKHYFVSLLLGNWDYLNFSFCNFGYYNHTLQGKTEIRGMTVDFGGSGTLGFGGLSKDESYERAIKGARPENPLESTSLFSPDDSTFGIDFPASLSSISTIPRSRPLLSTIKGVVKVEKDLTDHGTKDFQNYEKELAAAFEVAYRLLVLPNSAIETYLRQHWIMGTPDFPFRDKDPKHNMTTDKIIQVILGRKQGFIDYFGIDFLKNWEKKHTVITTQARQEIQENIQRLLGDEAKKHVVKALSTQENPV